MKNLFPLFILLFLLNSCNKKENSDLLWEKSFGKGEAISILASADSGFAACGFVKDKPYLVRFDKDRKILLEINADLQGLFSSFWYDTCGYITAGNSAGKMLLMRHSPTGNKLWEKSIDAGYRIDAATLIYTGNGNMLAIGSASSDTTYTGSTGILFVTFDTTGTIITQKNIPDSRFIACGSASRDAQGNLYLALTRKNTVGKPHATVAKYNFQFAKLWESELYNNPDFGASCQNLILDGKGAVFVTGHTELSGPSGMVNSSFLTSLSLNGTVNWKKYLEASNTGEDLLFDSAGDILMLNRNCCIIRSLHTSDGADAGTLRVFDACNSKDTDALGSSAVISYDKNLLVAGTRSKKFFIGLKATQTTI